MNNQDSFKSRKFFQIGKKKYLYYSLKEAQKNGLKNINRLPFSLRILLENLLRNEDGNEVKKKDIISIDSWIKNRKSKNEIAFNPARILMQDFTGVPAVVDLASMREAIEKRGGDAKKINPLIPVDLVIDHSVMVDSFGNQNSFNKNVDLEYGRNKERYSFLKWGSNAFKNFRVVPPGTGICHQVNLEYLARTVWSKKKRIDGKTYNVAYPDTVIGTDSHTTMVNGLSVLGWGVGGIEAEAAMLGQPISMIIPEVIGFKLTGKIKEGITATDLVLTIVDMLRKKGVVGKFVEFYGPGLENLSIEDRATIANMAPEYGATCGFFPIDSETIRYMKDTGRNNGQIELIKKYAKAQGIFRTKNTPELTFTSKLSLHLDSVSASLAGPKRPQDRVLLENIPNNFMNTLKKDFKISQNRDSISIKGKGFRITDGDVVIAAITSCTNTSNPSVMIGAGLVAKKAAEKGLKVKPWVKTSLAPGSQVVTDYLKKAGLQKHLNSLGFNLVGYGCTTCIGNSGPLEKPISDAININNIVVASVLSGNRNFEGRISQDVKTNYLASPMLVVAYAIAGSLNLNMQKDPLGHDKNGNEVFLSDIWPSNLEISQTLRKAVKASIYKSRYKNVFKGDKNWQKIKAYKGQTYKWDKNSTYVQPPPFFSDKQKSLGNKIKNANILCLLGDSITTDHISPAGAIKSDSPAGIYLTKKKVASNNFNSYGSRRGNHEVMMRGTFANIRIRNQMLNNIEGGFTRYDKNKKIISIYEAAMKYEREQKPLIVFAGKEYGTGSSRDWAAKGTRLLGVGAVIAESFERIHRSNLIGMGVLPFQFTKNMNWKKLGINGTELVNIELPKKGLEPGCMAVLKILKNNKITKKTKIISRIDTANELEYYKSGGILHYVLKKIV
tara:strand:+ start:3282 stop:5963 length:2682 start_codon:yes stop_codon:yes gene_type:complete